MKIDIDAIKHKVAYEKDMHHIGRDIKWFLFRVLIFLILVFLSNQFVLSGVFVDGDSMAPGIRDKDIALYYKLDNELNYGDVVIIKDKQTKSYYIKRVVGLPGDVIDLNAQGKLMVNDNEAPETYIVPTQTNAHDKQFPYTVPSGEFFVLGDNRSVSRDSRDNDFIKATKETIIGTLVSVVRLYT